MKSKVIKIEKTEYKKRKASVLALLNLKRQKQPHTTTNNKPKPVVEPEKKTYALVMGEDVKDNKTVSKVKEALKKQKAAKIIKIRAPKKKNMEAVETQKEAIKKNFAKPESRKSR